MSLAKVIQHVAAQGALFGASKAVVLVAPLLAAGTLEQALYGSVEWWVSIATPLSLVFSLGAPGVLAYASSLGDASGGAATAAKYSIAISALLNVVAITSFFGIFSSPNLGLAIILQSSALIVIQTALAAALKASGRGAWASLAESSFFTCLLLSCLATLLGLDFLHSFALFLGIGWTANSLILIIASELRASSSHSLSNALAFFRTGSRFMLAGLLMAIFMTSPRIALGTQANPIDIAGFAICFRWLSISIASHQFVNTVFFKKIYIDPNIAKRDTFQAVIVCLVLLGCTFITGFLQFIKHFEFSLPLPKDMSHILPFSIAMVLWSGSSCLEGNLQREGRNGAQIISVFSGLLVFICLSIIFRTYLDGDAVILMAWAWVGGFSAIFLSQVIYLHRADNKATRLRNAVILSIASILIVELLQAI